MDSMPDNYRGSLTPEERAAVDYSTQSLHNSVRETAKKLNLPYAKVRGYVEWEERAFPYLLTPPTEGAKILIFDIETSPQLAWGFFHNKYKVSIRDIERHSHFLTFAYKWLGQDAVGLVSQRHDPSHTAWSENDGWVARRLHRLFEQADIVIAHYGDRFDIPYANDRFLYHDLGPYPPFQSIDTKSESSRQFKTVSHGLGDLTHKHHLTEKLHNSGWDLWMACLANKPEAWDEMEQYNVQDVRALEDWYLKIRPWIGHNGKKKHPNLGHFSRSDEPVCPNCGNSNLTVRGWTPHRTQHYEYATMHCDTNNGGCGRYSRQAGVRRTIDPLDRIYAI